ncbi:MAG: hypothetical protein ACRENG_14990 [bacterium]
MYMRLLQIKIKPEKLPELRQFYETRVIPALQNLTGCRHASLIHSAHHEDECISFTHGRWRLKKLAAGRSQRAKT